MPRPVQEINAGSMADIAFLLLIFFLVTTTMDVDSGILRKLPPIVENQQENEDKIKERNVFVVLINKNNQLLVQGEWIDVRTLKDRAKEFIANPKDNPNLPEKKPTEVILLGTYPVTKGVISLQNDRGTSYEMYINVQNQLTAAYSELREEFAKQKFGNVYDKLDADQQKAVNEVYPQKISEAEPKNIGGKK